MVVSMLVKGIAEGNIFSYKNLAYLLVFQAPKFLFISELSFFFFSGPLTYNDQGRATLVGVVSWGHGCAVPNYAGVYSRVTEAMTWINEQLSQTC